MLRRFHPILLSTVFSVLYLNQQGFFLPEPMPEEFPDRMEAAPYTRFQAKETIWEYFHPLWGSDGEENFSQLGTVDLADFVSDPGNKLNEDFEVSAELEARVLFWMAIYAKYNSRVRILHDREDPRLIYGYLDFNPLFASVRTPAAARIAHRMERAVVRKLEQALQELATLSDTLVLEPEQREQLRDYLVERGKTSPAVLLELADGVRSQSGQSDVFQVALDRSSGILPDIELIFENQGLPKELAKIPFVESSFNLRAESKLGAIGLWQFVPRTARQMIHRSDKKQWRDPYLQTKAAARLLKFYRRGTLDWGTAVTAYNSGIGRVGKLVSRFEATDIDQLVAISDRDGGMGFAGRNFFSEVLAANLVEAYKTEILGLRPFSLSHFLETSRFENSFNSCYVNGEPPQPIAASTELGGLRQLYRVLGGFWR